MNDYDDYLARKRLSLDAAMWAFGFLAVLILLGLILSLPFTIQ